MSERKQEKFGATRWMGVARKGKRKEEKLRGAMKMRVERGRGEKRNEGEGQDGWE